jgi:hypothetical protein
VRKYCDIEGFYNYTRNSIEEFGSPDKGENFWIGNQVIRYEIVSGAMKLWLGLRLGLLKCLLDTITYVKVSGGHFELEDTIKCYTIINNGIGHKFHNLETSSPIHTRIYTTC